MRACVRARARVCVCVLKHYCHTILETILTESLYANVFLMQLRLMLVDCFTDKKTQVPKSCVTEGVSLK